MKKKIVAQERVLSASCRVLNFHFDFDIQDDYIASIEYIQDMNKETVPDSELYPVKLYVHEHDIWYVFQKSSQDRVYCLTLFKYDEEELQEKMHLKNLKEYLDDYFNSFIKIVK